MKNKLTKLLSSFLIILLTLFVVAGCKEKTTDEGYTINYTGERTELEIMYWVSGYGVDFMKETIKQFEIKNPQYKVKLKSSSDNSFIGAKLGLGADYDTVDLYMGIYSTTIPDYSVTLDDVYSYVNEGETKTIAEKLGKTAEYNLFRDGKYYSIPHCGGLGGICFNADIIDGTTYKVPNTTDELIALEGKLVEDNKVPFIHFINGGYWDYVLYVWFGQYCGIDALHELTINPTLEGLTNDNNGFKEALVALSNVIGNKKYILDGSNSYDFTEAQTIFLENETVMMVNGSWLEYEMKNNYQPGSKNIRMMKTPVISSIIKKCPSIADDAELSKLISAIDNNETSLTGNGYEVTQEDFDKVKEARNYLYNNAIGHACCIPKYSNNIEGAKEFLKFYYSDQAIEIFTNYTQSKHVADFDKDIEIDMSSWTNWSKEQYELASNCYIFVEVTRSQNKLFATGNASLCAGKDIVRYLSSKNDSDRISGENMWELIKNTHQSNWSTYQRNID